MLVCEYILWVRFRSVCWFTFRLCGNLWHAFTMGKAGQGFLPLQTYPLSPLKEPSLSIAIETITLIQRIIA